jgi:hypothetical protein
VNPSRVEGQNRSTVGYEGEIDKKEGASYTTHGHWNMPAMDIGREAIAILKTNQDLSDGTSVSFTLFSKDDPFPLSRFENMART